MEQLEENDTSILILDGDIQGAQVEELDKALNSLKGKKVQRVAIDMTSVGYIYSRGIGILVRAQKELQANGSGLYLYNLKNSMQKNFNGNKFDGLFERLWNKRRNGI